MLLLFMSLYSYGPGFYTTTLTFGALATFITTLINRKLGWTLALIVSSLWLIRFIERFVYLKLFDLGFEGRWIVLAIPIVVALALFAFSLKGSLEIRGKIFRPIWIIGCVFGFASLAVLSFARKSTIEEINCWHKPNFDGDISQISFATHPDHQFYATTESKEIASTVVDESQQYLASHGYYCPESKVEVITCFTKLVSVRIRGFRNTEIDKKIWFDDPIEIDLESIDGDKTILEPVVFKWGD